VEAKRLIGLVPESGALYEPLTPLEYLDFVGELHELDAVPRRARARELLNLLHLQEDSWQRRMTGFSKGMRQRVLIAAALLHEPQVLLFDEPLNGLDVEATVRVKEIIAEQAGRGRTILYCSHLLDVVERICSRILILSQGRLQLEGSLEEVRARHQGLSLEEIFQRHTGSRQTAPPAVGGDVR
jgi:ABC-2 type transport system ATP-binding protein